MVVKARIALLGGSFNPAHEGHVHISCEVKKRFAVDEVWWLVTPHNPLKQKGDIEALTTRLEIARRLVARVPFIKIKNLEAEIGTNYTIDTIRYLKKHYPTTQFYWVMGADNLVSFHLWKCWKAILKEVSVIVVNRYPFAHRAIRSKAALYARSVKSEMLFVFIRLHNQSSTDIRKKLGKNAFLCHNDER